LLRCLRSAVPLSCGLQISKDLRQTRIRNEHI